MLESFSPAHFANKRSQFIAGRPKLFAFHNVIRRQQLVHSDPIQTTCYLKILKLYALPEYHIRLNNDVTIIFTHNVAEEFVDIYVVDVVHVQIVEGEWANRVPIGAVADCQTSVDRLWSAFEQNAARIEAAIVYSAQCRDM